MTTSPSNEGWQDALEGSSTPAVVVGVLIHLNRLRSQYMVSRALVEAFPTEADWQQFQESQLFLETVTEFAEYVAAIRTGALLTQQSLAELEAALDREYPRALDGVRDLAVRLNVAPEDLLSVLINR